MIRFFVAGVPKAMSVGGASIKLKTGATFTTRRNTDWATLVGHEARLHMPPTPLDGALIFVATFYVPMPAYISRRERGTSWPIKRPDVDNLVHKLTDKLNGVFWKDDSQVTDILVRKRYPLDGRTGVEIVVAAVTNAQVMAQLDQVALDMEPAHR